MIEHFACWDLVNLPDLVGVELAIRIYSMEFEAQHGTNKDGNEGEGKKKGRGREVMDSTASASRMRR
eukprot:7468433-Pyramimonas_sp.AAC.1